MICLGQDADSIQRKKPVSIGINWDYGKTALVMSNFETKHEIGLELRFFEKIQLVVEAGRAELTPPNAFLNADYFSSGDYMRVGAGYFTKLDERNQIGLGLRYGVSTFQDEVTINIESRSGFNDSYLRNEIREDLNANWFEVVMTSERSMMLNKGNPDAFINKLFSIGFLFRFRVLLDYTSFEPVDVYAIPGYGRSFDRRMPALNLFLRVNLF
jgi:hypothetical protein